MLNVLIPHAKSWENYSYNVRSNKVKQFVSFCNYHWLKMDQEFEIVYYIQSHD